MAKEQTSDLLKKNESLESENKRLRKKLGEAEQEMMTLNATVYVGSVNRNIFHKPSCFWASFIIGSQNYVEFSSHRDAEDAGYKPCKTCRA